MNTGAVTPKGTNGSVRRRAVVAAALGLSLALPAVPALAASGGATTGADLQISGSASTGSPAVGASFVYTFQVKNVGPDTATSAILTDTLPGSFLFVAANVEVTGTPCEATPDASGNTVVSCPLGDIPKAAQELVDVTVSVPSVGSYPTTAGTTSTAADPNTANNQVTISVGVVASAGGGGGGGSTSTTTGVICGAFLPDVTAYFGYYGSGGIRVGGGFENCGTVKQEAVDVYFTDTETNPQCAVTIPPMGSKALNAGSTQTVLGVTSSGISSSCPDMVLTHTFSVDVTANGVDQGSYLWTATL